MADNLYDHTTLNIWSPNSQDLNLLDYYVKSNVEKEVNKHSQNTKDSIKTAIAQVISDRNKEQLIRTCNRFRPRRDASGGFIE